jgi:hypothetical protein
VSGERFQVSVESKCLAGLKSEVLSILLKRIVLLPAPCSTRSAPSRRKRAGQTARPCRSRPVTPTELRPSITIHYPLPTTHHPSPATHYPPHTTHHRPPVTRFDLLWPDSGHPPVC